MNRPLIRSVAVGLAWLAGCASSPQPAATQPVADIDGTVATAEALYSQPSAAVVNAQDFDALIAAAERIARQRLFSIDRRDPRNGIFVTAPSISSQVFEPWRQDQRSAFDTAQSTLAAIRRTIRFEVSRNDQDGFALSAKVLVERYAQAENRVTSVVLYRGAFRPQRDPSLAAYGTRETDRGVFLENRYWYPTGRDEQLEAALATDIQREVDRIAAK